MPRRSAAAAAVRYPRVAANRQLPPKVHARRSVHHQVSNLPFGSSGSRPRCFTSSPVHVSAPFGALGTKPGIRPVIQQRRHGGVATACWFPVGFRPPALLLGHPVPAREFRSPLRSAYRSASRRIGPCRGFRVPHARDTTGLGAFSTPGRRCLPDQPGFADRRLPLLNGQPCAPLKPPTCGAADNEAYEDSLAFTRPVFPSPVVPGWNRDASAFTLGFAPRGHPQRTPERGRPTRHWTESHPQQTTSNRT